MELTATIFTSIGAIAGVVGAIVSILAYKKAQKAISMIGDNKNIKNAKIKSGDNSNNTIGHNNSNWR